MSQETSLINVLLVDDQRIVGEAIKRMLADQDDIVLHYMNDPLRAVSEAVRLMPSVILQDLVMPDINGLDLVAAYRSDERCADVPLIVLSSKEDPQIKAEAFALGANDYLVKLPDKLELVARIRYHARAYQAKLQRDEAYRLLAHELGEAADYVRSLLPVAVDTPPLRSAWAFLPSMALGGDAFGHFSIDENHFAFFLLDVCGHGIGAALLSVSAMNALTNQTLMADFASPVSVLAALNQNFAMERHNNLYFTIWYGVFDRGSRVLSYSAAGHPPAVLVQDQVATELRHQSLPIGVMDDTQYSAASIAVAPESYLFLFSDGAYEITLPDGRDYLFEDFLLELVKPVDNMAEHPQQLLKTMQQLQRNDTFEDDVSILLLQF